MNQQAIQRSGPTRTELIRPGRYLEYFTIGYNSLEGLIAVVAGLIAGSIALVGFGFDSLIEVTSGAVLLWRLGADVDEARRERVEAISLRLVGFCFIVLALYMSYDSIKSLLRRDVPDESLIGIILAVVSLIVMPLLVQAKRRETAVKKTGLNSRSNQSASVHALNKVDQLVKASSRHTWYHNITP